MWTCSYPQILLLTGHSVCQLSFSVGALVFKRFPCSLEDLER